MLTDSQIRLEWLERLALADLHLAAPAGVGRRLGLAAREIAGALVSIAVGAPSARVNRALGLGVPTPTSREYVADIIAAFDEAGAPRYLVHAHPGGEPMNLPELIRGAGLGPSRAWEILSRGPQPIAARDSDFTIRRVEDEPAARAFGRIAAKEFGLGEDAADWLAGLIARPAWRLFVAYAGDQPAGAAGMFVHDGMAWFDWGAVNPLARAHGIHGDLINARIAEARVLGCELMATALPRPLSGEKTAARDNFRRSGFKTAVLRPNFGRE